MPQPAELDFVMRRSVRLANRPPTNADPAVRACETKLKKLGLTKQASDAKTIKKLQMLLKYTPATTKMLQRMHSRISLASRFKRSNP
jgi:hypothetical protein